MPTLRSGKPTETLKKHGKRKQSADELENGNPRLVTEKEPTQRETTTPDVVMITAEEANNEMLLLAAEAEEAVPPRERNMEWPIKVPGRLGLTGSKGGKSYNVTKGEIRRRMAAPEKLSASALCQYLKRRRKASELPGDIPNLQPKQKTCSSLFTLLTEGEAKDLAQDFGDITKKEHFFTRLSQNVAQDDRQTVRGTCIRLMEALDRVEETTCKASLRQHGFLVPAVREVFKQLHDGLE